MGAGVAEHPLAEPDRAAVGVLEAAEQAQQRRLAAARGAEDRGEAAGGDLEVEAGEHDRAAERLAQAGDGERCRRAHHRSSAGRHDAAEAAGQQVGGQGGDRDHQGSVGGGRSVGERSGLGPELRRQRLGADRRQQQGRGQLGDGGEEDQRRGGAEAGQDARQGDPQQRPQRSAAERAGDLLVDRWRLRQRRPGGDEGQRQREDRVGDDQQQGRVVDRREVVDREHDQRQRDDDPRQGEGEVGGALDHGRGAARVAHREDRDRQGEQGGEGGRAEARASARCRSRTALPRGRIRPRCCRSRPSRRGCRVAGRGRARSAPREPPLTAHFARPSRARAGGRAEPESTRA